MNTAVPMKLTHPPCPICACHDCTHFIGWTTDGRIVELRRGMEQIGDQLKPTDRTANTGVTTRVYRQL